MDYVLLSPNDGELLKKAHQMLLGGGVRDDVSWNRMRNPDTLNSCAKGRKVFFYTLCVYCYPGGLMDFHSHECVHHTTTQITLTPENLTESVATVLNAYKNAQK